MTQVKETRDARANAGCALFFGGSAVAALVAMWQGYMWLKTGHWPNLTLASTIAPLISGTDFFAWLAAPKSWFGLHSVAKSLLDLPLFFWIFVVGGLAARILFID